MSEVEEFRRDPVSFTRRGGRLKERQQRALDTYGPRFVIEVPRLLTDTSVETDYEFEPAAVFGRDAPLIVEIGTGRGEAITHAAMTEPDTDFLALEVWWTGIAQTLVAIAHEELPNVRIALVNAPEALATMLTPASVREVRMFFPDPWHKTRHRKRRLIDSGFARLIHRVLEPGGVVRVATDWEDYALQVRTVLDEAPGLERGFDGEWATRFEGRPETRFERKGTDVGRAIRDLTYLKA